MPAILAGYARDANGHAIHIEMAVKQPLHTPVLQGQTSQRELL